MYYFTPYGYLHGIFLIIIGILAAPNMVVSRKPEAKEWIDKLVPFQGWLGVVSLVWGIIQIIRFLTKLQYFDDSVLVFLTWIVSAFCMIVIGILLGINVIKSFVSDEQAKEKMDQLVMKLAPKQGNFGLISVIVGIWMIIQLIFEIA